MNIYYKWKCHLAEVRQSSLTFTHFCQQDTLILGSVETNSWRGSLRELCEQTQTEQPHMQMDSYLGIEHNNIYFISDYLLLYQGPEYQGARVATVLFQLYN